MLMFQLRIFTGSHSLEKMTWYWILDWICIYTNPLRLQLSLASFGEQKHSSIKSYFRA